MLQNNEAEIIFCDNNIMIIIRDWGFKKVHAKFFLLVNHGVFIKKCVKHCSFLFQLSCTKLFTWAPIAVKSKQQ